MKRIKSIATAFGLAFAAFAAQASAETRVIILGTGTPVPNAERSGPGLAVIPASPNNVCFNRSCRD